MTTLAVAIVARLEIVGAVRTEAAREVRHVCDRAEGWLALTVVGSLFRVVADCFSLAPIWRSVWLFNRSHGMKVHVMTYVWCSRVAPLREESN